MDSHDYIKYTSIIQQREHQKYIKHYKVSHENSTQTLYKQYQVLQGVSKIFIGKPSSLENTLNIYFYITKMKCITVRFIQKQNKRSFFFKKKNIKIKRCIFMLADIFLNPRNLLKSFQTFLFRKSRILENTNLKFFIISSPLSLTLSLSVSSLPSYLLLFMPKLKEFHFKILCLTGHIIAIKIVIGDVVEVFLAICFTAYTDL